jgi:DNA-binding transcriptional ArsR family regulator
VAIRFLLPDRESESVAFAYSPLVEAVLSLHVLAAPKHHPLQHGWVRRMQKLDSPLRAAIRDFRFAYERLAPDFVFPSARGEFPTFAEELQRVRGLDGESLAFEFLRPLYDHGGAWPRDPALLARANLQRYAVENARSQHGAESAELAQLIFDDPVELGSRFCDLLERYWEHAFADEWDRLEPLLAKTVEEAGVRISELGLFDLLADFRPQLQVEPDQRLLWMKLPHEHELAITPEEALVLSPSAFVWPHIRINCDPPWPVGLIYPAPFVAREAGPKLPPDDLLRVLRAVSDETRLHALALIAEKPRSTQELAPLVGLTEAGLSKHLRILADAGVVTSKRDGYYVLYSLALDRLAPLSAALLEFLGTHP